VVADPAEFQGNSVGRKLHVTRVTERNRSVTYGLDPNNNDHAGDRDMRGLRHSFDRFELTGPSVDGSSQDDVLSATHHVDATHGRLDQSELTSVTVDGSSQDNVLFSTHLADAHRLEHVGAYVDGTSQDDVLFGTPFADTMHGHEGNDTLYGLGGNDQIFGDAGDDRLFGGAGNDILDGGDGNDILFGGTGADTLIGGAGTDTASYEYASSGVLVDLATGGYTGEAAGDTYSGIENVNGSAYGDIINGDNSNNVINGDAGDDFLFGEGGNDTLIGGFGNDILRGGAGNDTLIAMYGQDTLTGDDPGTFGYDTFVFAPELTNGHFITDFQHGFDHIDLTAFTHADGNLLGSDGQIAIGSCHATGLLAHGTEADNPVWSNGGLEANDHLVFDPTSSTLYYVNAAWSDQSHGYYIQDARAIVTLEGVHELSASDLTLYHQYANEHVSDPAASYMS
jgi:Ca2+-binding RTX toxin-like protein